MIAPIICVKKMSSIHQTLREPCIDLLVMQSISIRIQQSVISVEPALLRKCARNSISLFPFLNLCDHLATFLLILVRRRSDKNPLLFLMHRRRERRGAKRLDVLSSYALTTTSRPCCAEV